MTAFAEGAAPQRLVWAFASVASVAIHTALAALLLTFAHLAAPNRTETQISISTLEGATLAAAEPDGGEAVAPVETNATAFDDGAVSPDRARVARTAVAPSGGAQPARAQALPDRTTVQRQPARAAEQPDGVRAAAPVEAADTARQPRTAEAATSIDETATAAPVEQAATAAPVGPSGLAPTPSRAEPAKAAPDGDEVASVIRAESAAIPDPGDRTAPVGAAAIAGRSGLPESAAPVAVAVADLAAGVPRVAPARPIQNRDLAAGPARPEAGQNASSPTADTVKAAIASAVPAGPTPKPEAAASAGPAEVAAPSRPALAPMPLQSGTAAAPVQVSRSIAGLSAPAVARTPGAGERQLARAGSAGSRQVAATADAPAAPRALPRAETSAIAPAADDVRATAIPIASATLAVGVDGAAPAASNPPTTAEGRVARIARFLRGYKAGSCFTGLVAGAEGNMHVKIFTDNVAAFYDYQSHSEGAVPVYFDPVPVEPGQCAALAFASSLPRWPEFGLRIQLDSSDVVNGAKLTGRLTNVQSQAVYLLIVDSQGLVTQASRYLEADQPGEFAFAAPLPVPGAGSAATQILIAIAAERPTPALEGLIQAPGKDLFSRLKDASEDGSMDFAMAAFVAR